ncbi:beta-N-acetylhexosaminidase [Nocardioides agariphilus]|uniref:Beta-N-acetylhexosaminidase n=1 Tax=Nocardioides agariphilus TaxID=433664 RepID=A0A930VQJ9_9ACTN|nr:beta-N-acetylhexosaminidase [Nocardioides agariphilus]
MRPPLTGALVVALVCTAVSSAAVPVAPASRGTSASAVGAPAADPTGTTTWGPTAAEVTRADQLVADLSLNQLAGQVIVAGYRGTGSPAGLVRRLHLGGVVPVADNIVSAEQLRSVVASVQQAARGRGYPAFVGIDQEGGRVVRVHEATPYPAFMSTGAAGRPDLTRLAARASAREMSGLGFTAVLAPDADVTRGPRDPVIGTRSASEFPAQAAEQVVAAQDGVASAGLIATLKHFPGHGSATVDSHLALPELDASLEQLRARDLVPFQAGIEAGATAVMVGHLDVRAVDPGVPASLSRKVVDGLLRGELGFEGLVLTDALSMRAVSRHYGPAQAAVRALRAGVDVVLMPADPEKARDGIVAAVRQGRLPRSRVEEAAARMVALLLHVRHAGVAPLDLGTSAWVSAKLSQAALTSVSGPCQGRLVTSRVRLRGPAAAVAAFEAAARRQGLAIGDRGTKVALVTDRPARAGVVVALDRPEVLARSQARVRVATYGETPGAMNALVAYLVGSGPAPGRLPTRTLSLPRSGC